jgi:hypothetical protein
MSINSKYFSTPKGDVYLMGCNASAPNLYSYVRWEICDVTMSTFIPCVTYEHVFMLYSSAKFTPRYEFSFKVNLCYQPYY